MKNYVARFLAMRLMCAVLILAGWLFAIQKAHCFELLSLTNQDVFAHEKVAAVTATLYVSHDGTCGGMTPCYTTIQAAVDAAIFGGTIKIAAGAYHEDLNLPFSKDGDNSFIPLEPVEEKGAPHETAWPFTKTLTLEGGWQPEATALEAKIPESSKTKVNSVTISDGMVIIDSLYIQDLSEGDDHFQGK
jgi:pectin methylesterase-like acyl-CoA thioesterase